MLTKTETERQLADIAETAGYDPEVAHASADAILVEFLEGIGYKRIVELYKSIEPKWYA